MKKVLSLTALVGALAVPAAAFGGNGGGLDARLAKLDARVAKYAQKCQVASPRAHCAARQAKLSARLTKVEGNLDARIAKAHSAKRIAKLQAARDHVASLLASIS